MIIINKNEGTKIPYEVDGYKLCFDDDLTINLQKRQEDWDVHIDICFDADRALVIGAAAGRAYVGEIDIPARKYEEIEPEEGSEDESPSRTALPLDMDEVKLTLWAID